MEVAATVTVWTCFSAFLILPHLGAPAALARAAMGLLTLELVAVAIWSYGSDGCTARPCGTLPETARTAAAFDLPLLTAALVCLCVAYGLRCARAGR